MSKTKFIRMFFLVLTVVLLMSILCTTVSATDELGTLVPPVDDAQGTEVYINQSTQVNDAMQETEYYEDDYYDEYIEDTEEETEAPTYYDVYKDELPQIESEQLTEPTTAKIPDIEVSDTSLIGGVIMWLCVAVGIAVVAGVLVSQRTRQTGPSSGSRDDRRR